MKLENKIMKLYYGTSYNHFIEILVNKLKPLGETKSNCNQHPNKNNMVYLTTTYPFTFSFNEEKGAVFEIDLLSLDHNLLYLDINFIWSVIKENNKHDLSNDTIFKTVEENIKDFQHYWVHSINSLSTCLYDDMIDPLIIERCCIIDWKKRTSLQMEILDPIINVVNHSVMCDHYQEMVQWFFGDIQELPQVKRIRENQEMFPDKDFQHEIDYWNQQSKSRLGIDVMNFKNNHKKTLDNQ